MQTKKNDTICAISTPFGISGIGIIRLSGPGTYKIVERIFRPAKKTDIRKVSSHTVRYGYIVDKDRMVDEVLVTIMSRPKSYTREDMAEIGCHGGIIPLKEVLSVCIKNGARLAHPGEFTKRAFLNGRIDLTQAESILEVIYSKTERSLDMAVNKLKGRFSEELSEIRRLLLEVLYVAEAKINFPDEEDVETYGFDIAEETKKILSFLERILSRAGKGRIMQQGINAAITGRTNAGKSSLLNALLKEERAIVTEVPGTTRDIIQETMNIKGVPVNIIDTAGIRKVRGRIEKMGVDRALAWMEKAEINLVMLDGSKKMNEYDRQLLQNVRDKNYIIIINKNDLPERIEREQIEKDFSQEKIVSISAKTGDGIERLEDRIYTLILKGYGEIKGNEVFLNIRQEGKIREIRETLNLTEKEVEENAGLEIVAENLKGCIKKIDELTGRDISEEVMEKIFSQFCIGK
jgi:tRNA modification GTPase